MHILSDLFVLYMAIAVTYIAAWIWRYIMSRAPLPESHLRAQMQALETTVRTINESNDISVKLARIHVAIEIAKDIDCLLPADSDIREQTAQLEDMRTALSNDALRLKVNELSAKLRSETDGKQWQQLGQQLLTLLAKEKEKQLADPQLIVHYDITIQQYLEARQKARVVKQVSDDTPEHIAQMLAAHDSVMNLLLENDIPASVRFFNPSDATERSECGQAVFDLSFEINGYRVEPNDLTHELGRSVLQTIQRSVSKRVHSIRCPEHGSAPRIIVIGQSLGDLSWKVPGCCAKLRHMVKRKLQNCH